MALASVYTRLLVTLLNVSHLDTDGKSSSTNWEFILRVSVCLWRANKASLVYCNSAMKPFTPSFISASVLRLVLIKLEVNAQNRFPAHNGSGLQKANVTCHGEGKGSEQNVSQLVTKAKLLTRVCEQERQWRREEGGRAREEERERAEGREVDWCCSTAHTAQSMNF